MRPGNCSNHAYIVMNASGILSMPDNILKSVLCLYMNDFYHPLPTPEEVLICTPNTTAEEVGAEM